MKRTKQMQILVDDTNRYLKANRITKTNDSVFIIVTNGLIHADCYHGFNWHDESGRLAPENPHHLFIY